MHVYSVKENMGKKSEVKGEKESRFSNKPGNEWNRSEEKTVSWGVFIAGSVGL